MRESHRRLERDRRKQLSQDIKHYKQVIREGRKTHTRPVIRNAKKQKTTSKRELRKAKKDKNKFVKMLLYRNKTMFSLLKAIFNGLWFIVLYFAYIKNLPRTPFFWDGAISLGYTGIGVTITRLLSWSIAFWITEHSNFEKNVQYFLRSLLITVSISVLYFFGVFMTLYANLDLRLGVAGYVLIQFLVFTLADFLVDNFLFQH